MLPSLQMLIAILLSAVACGCFALAAHHSGRSAIAALLAAMAWLFAAVAVALLITVV
jgi:hypothetical protein